MKIRMKSISAGPDGVFGIGALRELPDAEAAELVKGGYAEAAEPSVPERATLAPALEKRLDRMKKEELIALAATMGVTLKGDETNKQIIELLNAPE